MNAPVHDPRLDNPVNPIYIADEPAPRPDSSGTMCLALRLEQLDGASFTRLLLHSRRILADHGQLMIDWLATELPPSARAAGADRDPAARDAIDNPWHIRELRPLLRATGFVVASDELDDLRTGPGMRLVAWPAPRPPDQGQRPPAEQAFCDGLRLAWQDRLREAVQALTRAVALAPALAEHYRLLWDIYARAIRASHHITPDPLFARRGHRIGRLPAAAVQAMRRSLDSAAVIPVTAGDHAPGYMYNSNLSSAAAAAINQDNDYLRLGPAQLACARPLLEALSEPVRACLGAPWRVLNLRCWRTRAGAGRTEANGWHHDEPYPPEVRKIIIYLTETGADTGTTEIVQPDAAHFLASGPPGTFVVFHNFELLHRGVPPRRGERLILEVTVAPHDKDDRRPVLAGMNADFPLTPWMALEHP